MSFVDRDEEVLYPESDDREMAESDLHRGWMLRIHDILRFRYHGQRVFVGGNLLVFYAEFAPLSFVAPDTFVVKDCDPSPRRTFKIWEEGKTPNVVFEVTSRERREEDEIWKLRDYTWLAVPECFMYDPAAEYLDPPLQGFRFIDGDYRWIEPDATGTLRCEQLDILLRLEDGRLVLRDGQTGEVLLTEAEAAVRVAAQRAAEA